MSPRLNPTKSLGFFLVENGDVSPAKPDTPFDGENTLLVLASSEQEALEIARAYDAGNLGIDNVCLNGKPVAVATFWHRYS